MNPGTQMFGGDNITMVAMMEPLLHEVGREVLTEHPDAEPLRTMVRNNPKLYKFETAEQFIFAMLAIKKYGATREEAYQLIVEGNAVSFCFDKYGRDGGLDHLFNKSNPEMTVLDTVNGVATIGIDKKGMILMLKPVMDEIGQQEMKDRNLIGELSKLLAMSRPKSDTDLGEQMIFAVLAVKKYKISVEQAHQLVLEDKAISFCFEKFVADGGMDDMFDDPNVVSFTPTSDTKH